MNKKYYIAIDVGLSSGVLSKLWIEEEKVKIEEIYSFENKPYEEEGSFFWDVELLIANIIEGLVEVAKQGITPVSIGIDTWAVDYVLVNRRGDMLGEVYAYRDLRTMQSMEEVHRKISPQELYEITGIQIQSFNTIYQLVADQILRPNVINAAQHFLMLPEYVLYRLTGTMVNEYTIASTTGLLDARKRTWSKEILDKLGLPQGLFQEITFPGKELGELLPEVVQEVGFQSKVVLVATHDTASAVMGIPLEEKKLYLSNGTWSLMGVEEKNPTITAESFADNVGNEGGYQKTYRLQKNMMGLWMLQNLRIQDGEGRTYGDMAKLAQEEIEFPSRIDVNEKMFFSPESVAKAVKEYCIKTSQQVPENLGQILAVVYHSLAQNYQKALMELESIAGKTYDTIYVVGGGSRDKLLNQLIANTCKREVIVGPSEASAIGNGLCQMLAEGVFSSLEEGRKTLKKSFEVTLYKPQ